MKSKVLLVLILLVPQSSASLISSTSSSGPDSIFARLKILIFGEFSLSLLFTFNQPDLGLFLFDVGSDIYNGITFIDEGNKIWGIIILGVIFIPMTVFYVATAISISRNSSGCKKLLILLFAPILAALAIPIMTVAYLGCVAYVFARRCIQPGFNDKEEDNFSFAGLLKLVEAVCEANLQAVLGWFSSLFTIIRKTEIR